MAADWPTLAQEISTDLRPLIDGVRTDPTGQVRLASQNPATGEVVASGLECSPDDVHCAVQSARRSFLSGWGRLSVRERSTILMTFADLLDEHADELGLLDSLEMGMPISGSVSDIAVGSGLVRWCAQAAATSTDIVLPHLGSAFNLNLRVPRGVVGAIVPWNFPTFNALSKLGPALATGNTVVLKPSEVAPLSALLIGELLLEAGAPPGTANVVPGCGVVTGEALALHNDVDHLSFTGSTLVGRRLMECSAASNLKTLALELGGKSPQIVLADAPDLDVVAQSVCDTAFWNSGQVCTSGSRLLVHESLHDELVEKVSAIAQAIEIGDPLDNATTHGPLANRAQHSRVGAIVNLALDGGATVHAGADARPNDGCGFAPTVLGVAPDDTSLRGEIFGPVMSVQRFTTQAEAVTLANDTEYGLAAYVWTGQPSAGYAIARQLICGMVNINPGPGSSDATGGSVEPARASGFGAEGGLAGLNAYTRMQLVSLTL